MRTRYRMASADTRSGFADPLKRRDRFIIAFAMHEQHSQIAPRLHRRALAGPS